MEPDGLLPHSQESDTSPYPGPDQYSYASIPLLENTFYYYPPTYV